jgi:hypothetical protein
VVSNVCDGGGYENCKQATLSLLIVGHLKKKPRKENRPSFRGTRGGHCTAPSYCPLLWLWMWMDKTPARMQHGK